MKRANRYVKILLVVFLRKNFFHLGNLIFLGHFLLFDMVEIEPGQNSTEAHGFVKLL